MDNFFSEEELQTLGFAHIGKNVLISKKASIYGAENISIGNNVRIDDFCILSGHITIGNYVHIAAFTALYGRFGIEIQDFCGISSRGTIYSAVDDFSGEYMVSPMVPEELTNLKTGKVILKKFTQLGCNTTVFPSCVLNEGVATGAMTLVKQSIPAWKIAAGIPAKIIKDRKKSLLDLEKNIKK